MNLVVLGLILASAITHTYWNFVLKRAINSGADNVLIYWLSGVAGVLMYSVIFFIVLARYGLTRESVILSALCGLFLAAYVFLLSKSYQHADLSQVYPLARITPLFTLLIGVFYLKETVGKLAFVGILFIVAGIYSMHLSDFRNLLAPLRSLKHKGSLFALATAIVSAGYGLFSKLGAQKTNPFLFVYLAYVFTALFYTPFLFFKTGSIRSQIKNYKKEIIKIGLLDLFGYSLILVALSFDNLSSVFALRQISIIFSVLAGVFIFKEQYGRQRIMASALIVLGILLISISS